MFLFLLLGLVFEQGSILEKLPNNWQWEINSQGPICGAYAVSRALSLIGKDVQPDKLCNTGVVGHKAGSSPEELLQALEQNGVQGSFKSSMSTLEIYAAGCPIIANVKANPKKHVYDHWVCVTSSNDGLVIFDGPAKGKLIKDAEFLAQWNGNGIIVANTKTNSWMILFARLISCIGLALVSYVILSINNSDATVLSQACRIGLATFAVLVTSTLMFNLGYGYSQACNYALKPFSVNSTVLRNGGFEDLEIAIASDRHMLVDARKSRSYASGSIKGAINIPINAPEYEIEEFTRELPRDTPIVVFCQSLNCAYDEVIAKTLIRVGFLDVTVSDIGFAEYSNRKKGD